MNKDEFSSLQVGNRVMDKNGNIGKVIAIDSLDYRPEYWAKETEVHCDNDAVSMFPDELKIVPEFIYKSAYEITDDEYWKGKDLFFVYRDFEGNGKTESICDIDGPEENAKLIVNALNEYTRKNDGNQ